MDNTETELSAGDPGSFAGKTKKQAVKIWGDVRQWLFKPTFRISAPKQLFESAFLQEAKVGAREQASEAAAAETETRGTDTKELLKLVCDLATGLWRIRRKILDEGNGQPPENWRRLYRYVESAWDALHSANVEVKDHTGERYVAGMALRVMAFQPRPGASAETVEETVKPSVFCGDSLVQRGEVIVAVPPNECDVSDADRSDTGKTDS